MDAKSKWILFGTISLGIFLLFFSIYGLFGIFEKPKQTSNPEPENIWKTYEALLYQIDYPYGWQIIKNQVVEGGEILLIKPTNLTADEIFPSFHIKVYKSRGGFLAANLAKDFQEAGFSPNDVTFSEKPAIKLERQFGALRRLSFLFDHAGL